MKLNRVFKKIRLRTYISLGFLFILLPLVAFSLFKPGKTEATWMDDSWGYRTTLSFTHNALVSNTKVKFDIDTATLITAGKMQSDCGDSRFTDINGDQLPYYLDSVGGACNTSSTDYYVLIPTIVSGSNVIYHYYGNPSVSNGTQLSQFAQSTTTPSGGAASTGTEEKETGPVAYWNFDEGYGTSAHDLTSSANIGTLGGSTLPVWKTEDQCVSGKCLYYDGSTSYVSAGNPTSLKNTGTFTVSAWIRLNDFSSSHDIVTKYASGTERSFVIYTNSSGNLVAAVSADGTTFKTVTGGSVLTSNQWQFVTVVYVPSTSITLYVNGLVNQTSVSSIPASVKDSTANFIIGSENTGSTNNFKGFIDELKFYNYAHSAAQIKVGFNSRGSNEGVSASFGGAAQKTLSDGLVGYWKMDETAANSCTGGSNDNCDSNGNANDGAWNGNAVNATGKYANGVTFDGSGDYVSMGNGATLNATLASRNTFTVSTWIKTSASANQTIIMHGDETGNQRLWRIQTNSSGKATAQTGDTGTTSLTSTTSINTGNWVQLTIVKTGSGSTDTFKLYVNGVEEASATGPQDCSPSHTDKYLMFGISDDFGTTTGEDFNGSIDDARIYNRALSPGEVRTLYNFAPGPVAYWKMDEKTGTTTNDSSGNANTGTLTNGPTWGQGKSGGAVTFDGADDYVDGGSAAVLDNIPVRTVEAWIYPRSLGESSLGKIYSKIGSGYTQFQMGSGNNILFQHSFATQNGNWSTPSSSITLNAWNYVAATYDRTSTSNVPIIYINGISQTLTTVTSPSGTVGDDSSGNFLIGSKSDTTEAFDGNIDEFKIYNYARTPSQIVEDMNGGHPVGGSPVGSYVSYWNMDEANGTMAHDRNSINNNSITLSAASWDLSGKTNTAWKGLGTNWLSRADDDDFDLANTDDGSISMWFKSTSASNPGATEYLFAKGRGTPPGYALYLNTTGNLCYSVDDDSTWTPDDSACTTADVYDGTWHHVVATKTGTTEIRLYLDGRSTAADTSIAATATLANSGILYVGDDDGDATNAFNGDIDEVKFYRSALTRDQVLLDMNAGASLNFGVTASPESSQLTSGTGTAPINDWPMDEKTGTAVNDIGTGAKNGTISGNTTWTHGKYGSALLFDGSTGVDAVGGFTPPAIMTYETWFNARSLGENSLGRIAVHSNFDLFLLTSLIQFQANWSTAGKWTVPIPSFGAWHHLVVVYDSGSVANDPVIYIDGVSQTVTETQTPVGSITLSSATLRIGNTSGDDRTFDGAIDESKIYNYARSAGQVAYGYNRGAPVGFWRLDECQGTTAYDSTGNGNHGSIAIGAGAGTGHVDSVGTCNTSSTAWGNGATGKFNSGLSLDGIDDSVDVGESSLFDITQQITLSAWVKINGVSGNRYIIAKWQTDPGAYQLYEGNPNAPASFRLNTNGNGVVGTTSINDNVWHLVTGTYDHVNMKIYVDGKLQATRAYSSNINSFPTENVYLGRFGESSPANYLSGQIDDARIYNYALSNTQVQKLYQEGSSVFFGPASGQP